MIIEIISHFHPVLVHLPIGILLLAILFHWLSTKEKYTALAAAIPIAYLAGAITAAMSCVTGYLLGGSGEYDETTLNLHQWMGIIVAFSAAAGYLFSRNQNASQLKWVSIGLLLLLTVTGHLGGTLTHGEGYLWKTGGQQQKDSIASIKPLANAQEAIVYQEIISPILKTKCYNCHAATKQKGGLRLDAAEWIQKGGKNGKVLVAGSLDSSVLYKRLILDPVEEKHMPPKGKPQLTEQEILLMKWWVASGADFAKKSKELEQSANIKAALTGLEKAVSQVTKRTDIPETEVKQADEKTIDALRKASVTILPIAENSHWLSANFVNAKKWDASIEKQLLALQDQLIWLKIPAAQLTAGNYQQIAQLKNLRRLSAEHSNITDADLPAWKGLEQLQYLNLVDTKVSAKGLVQLKPLVNLKQLFLGSKGLSVQDYASIKSAFPKAQIDTGGYRVPAMATDTIQLHPKEQ